MTIRVGVIGCGDVATYVYLPTLKQCADLCTVTAVCDRDPDRARLAAEQFAVPQVYTDLDRFLQEAPVEAVLNLTPNQHHFAVSLAALQAGKHVYTEKTLAVTLEEADRLLAEAEQRGLIFASAPAVMLNPVNQVARQLLQEGAIGRVCYAIGHAAHGGPARRGYFAWYRRALEHLGLPAERLVSTDPTWFYQPGAGPLLDLGVYALTTLTGLLGPVRQVTALSGRQVPELVIEGGVAQGRRITVAVDDTTLLLLDFGNATFAMVDASYNVLATRRPQFEIYGSSGVITMNPQQPAPPQIEVYRGEDLPTGEPRWERPAVPGPRWHLGAGIPHFLECLRDRRRPIISGEHARHVLEVMLKAYAAATEGRTQTITRLF